MANAPRMDAFTRQYFETALWSSNDESDDQGGEPLDKNYGVGDIADETRWQMIADCADFQKRFGQLYDDSEQAGHDFWLSRNGHGTGFFDRDTEHADELQAAAKSYGEFDLYVGDDGEIHGTPIGAPGRDYQKVRSSGRHVSDFNTLNDLLEHARGEGATHYLQIDDETHLYFKRRDGRYEKSEAWQKDGYWHTQAPGSRAVVARPPSSARPIGGRTVRDYEAVDNHDRVIAGPFKSYGDAKTEAERVRGVVRFVPSKGHRAPPRASEAARGQQFEVVNPDGRVISHITAPTIERAQTDLARGKNAGHYPRGSRIKGARLDESPRPTRSAHNPRALQRPARRR